MVSAVMLLSCPAKKVTKECGLRGARRQRAPLRIPRRHTELQHGDEQLKTTILGNLCFGQKIGTFFARTGFELRCSSGCQVRAGGFQRGRLWCGSNQLQRPFGRLLLVLFLAKQEKYITALYVCKRYTFPQNKKPPEQVGRSCFAYSAT